MGARVLIYDYYAVTYSDFKTTSWVLLAWISRYLDNLDSAISSLNIARIQEILCMILVYITIYIMHNISLKITQDLGWILHYLGCQDI